MEGLASNSDPNIEDCMLLAPVGHFRCNSCRSVIGRCDPRMHCSTCSCSSRNGSPSERKENESESDDELPPTSYASFDFCIPCWEMKESVRQSHLDHLTRITPNTTRSSRSQFPTLLAACVYYYLSAYDGICMRHCDGTYTEYPSLLAQAFSLSYHWLMLLDQTGDCSSSRNASFLTSPFCQVPLRLVYIVLLCPNGPEWIVADLACAMAGFVSVPVATTMTAVQLVSILNFLKQEQGILVTSRSHFLFTLSVDSLRRISIEPLGNCAE